MSILKDKKATHKIKIKPESSGNWFRANQEFDVIDSASIGYPNWEQWIALDVPLFSPDCIDKDQAIIIKTYKTTEMSNKLEITAEQVKKAAEENPSSKKLLQDLFPQAFSSTEDELFNMLPKRVDDQISAITIENDPEKRICFYFGASYGYKWEVTSNGKSGGIFVTPVKR